MAESNKRMLIKGEDQKFRYSFGGKGKRVLYYKNLNLLKTFLVQINIMDKYKKESLVDG